MVCLKYFCNAPIQNNRVKRAWISTHDNGYLSYSLKNVKN